MKRTILIYGLVSGVVLILMQVLNYKMMIRDLKIEFFGLAIAAISISLGVWLGIEVIKRKQGALVRMNELAVTDLSKREIEVLALMAEGLSNQEMADKLFVSLNTIKTHNAKIFQKLNVARRTQAVKKAKDLRIIEEIES